MVDVPPVFGQAVDDVPPRPGSFATLDEVIAFEAAANAHAPADQVAVLASGSVRPGPAGLERCHDPYFLGEWPFRGEDHWPAVRGVTCPALLVRAENSFVLSEELAVAEADALGAALVEIGPSGHLVPVDQPALVRRRRPHLPRRLTLDPVRRERSRGGCGRVTPDHGRGGRTWHWWRRAGRPRACSSSS